jgi:cystathionine beta-lyase/cystathionine gamma-synthase
MRFATKAIHAGVQPDPSTGAIMTPIYQTSTYVQSSPGVHKGYEYSRTQNPTRDALQKSVAALENAQYGLCFASGVSATDAIMKTLRPGDEVVANNDLYGGTYRIFTKIYQNFGIKFRFVDMEDIGTLASYFTPATKLVWVETPSNPLLNIIDLAAVARTAHQHGCKVVSDNTFRQPLPAKSPRPGRRRRNALSDQIPGRPLGRDHGGPGDQRRRDVPGPGLYQNASGAVPGPQDCFLVLRGIKTLHVRVQRHCENGRAVARFLADHPKVSKVYWPGLEGHKNHQIAKAQMRDFGA